ncbi:MAG: hypothetical protein HY059_22715 [Proteobacteria bacterium]|nr:hypothetical protein [Pseudomonadota bacterium]
MVAMAALLLALSARPTAAVEIPWFEKPSGTIELHVPPVPPPVFANPVRPTNAAPSSAVRHERAAEEMLRFERGLVPLARTKFDRLFKTYETRNAYAQLQAFRQTRLALFFADSGRVWRGKWYRTGKTAFRLGYGRLHAGRTIYVEVRVRNTSPRTLRDVRLWGATEAHRGAAPEGVAEVLAGDLAPGREFIARFPLRCNGGAPLSRILLAGRYGSDAAPLEMLGYTYWWGLFS